MMDRARIEMFFQLTWKILPGLRGLSCSDFRAVATAAPDMERGVAFEAAGEEEAAAIARELEDHFEAQRFSNNAAAFETVKEFVIARASRLGANK
jgi:hypothetical protein